MDKTLLELFSEVPKVWSDHLLAAYLLGLKDMLPKNEDKHANIYFDVCKDQAEACHAGRQYHLKEGVDF